ncbi:ArsR/SmtB family transcription factor [Agromyces sp. MMS24-K17]|uniref:ArsR/SmtB family transcription factor n=1 Tax=Agromyces sp. MMS24-K17 TaxID=3372850 RepID=UPI0037549AC9
MHPFEVLAEPVRRRIVEVLAVGEHPVGIVNDVIAMEFKVSRSAVSHHLRILRNEGVVIVEPDEQTRLYRLDDEFIDRLDQAVADLHLLHDHRYGSRLRHEPPRPPGLLPSPRPTSATATAVHRAGRKGQRGRTPFEHRPPEDPRSPRR